MRKIAIYAVGVVTLGLVLTFSNAFGSGENPGPAATKAADGSTMSAQGQGDTKMAAAMSNTASGSVEVKLTEYKIEMPATLSAGTTTFAVIAGSAETTGLPDNCADIVTDRKAHV